MAGRRNPPSRAERGRNGRRAHLRARRSTPCRDLDRRHDSRLGTPSLRFHGQSLQRHNQPRARSKPRMLRHILQATGHNRVGIKPHIAHFIDNCYTAVQVEYEDLKRLLLI